MTTNEKLTIIRNKAAADLPALLAAVPVPDFQTYLIGPPDDAEKRQLSFYLDKTTDSADREDFNILVQGQLHGVLSIPANEYYDIVRSFMKSFDPSLIGMQIRGEIDGDMFPLDENSSPVILISVEFQDMVDDCNYN